MSNDPFFDRIRAEAEPLRYRPSSDFAFSRMSAAVRERINAPATVSQLLAAWFRPVAASLSAVALAAILGVSWMIRMQETSAEQVATVSMQIAMDGDVYSVSE